MPDGLRDIEEAWSLDDLQQAHHWLDFIEATRERAEQKTKDESSRKRR